MPRLTQIAIAMLLTVPAVSRAVADDRVPGKDRPQRIQFRHTDMITTDGGKLGVHLRWQRAATAKRPGPPPESYHLNYFWDGAHIQATIDHQLVSSDAKYLTADYSTNPPRVILTKQPTKDSRWNFVASGTERLQYAIKNENVRGKDAWLDLEDSGRRYSTPWTDVDVHVYTPILSFRDKTEFIVIDVLDDGGK